jgi:hypothetical protein
MFAVTVLLMGAQSNVAVLVYVPAMLEVGFRKS